MPLLLRRVALVGVADEAGRPRRVQAHERVEAILEEHRHLDAAEQLAQQQPLVHALPPAFGPL